jgi:hypothetical protein
LLILGSLVASACPAVAHAQAPSPSGQATLDALIREVRLLRQTLERQSAAAARAQLIVARLTLYDQRAARARERVERLESEVVNTGRERDQLRLAASENARAIEQAADPTRRQQHEMESRMLRTRLADLDRQRGTAEARLGEARQTLDAETARYDELERWLNDLDRQMQPAP